VTVSHQHLEEILAILYEVSHDYDLIVNPKKCGIFAVKKHYKFKDEMGLRGISIMIPEYCYLRVTLDLSQADFTLTWKITKNDLITYVPTCGTILKIFFLRISTCCAQYT
jgi:hypothetical protein